MKKIPVTSFVLCLLIMLIISVVSASAQICRPESIPATAPASRFTDNGDGTVTDKATGLMWKQCAEGLSGADCGTGSPARFSWKGALKRAQDVNSVGFAGYFDWRVPNINELVSIVEEQCYEPAINLSLFPETPLSYFWSSSPKANVGNYAWFVNFNNGYDFWYGKNILNYVRLVRSGQ